MVTQTASGVKTAGATLTASDAIATIGVKDLKAARRFYEEKLGFEPMDMHEDDVVTYRTGRSKMFVYKSELAGKNKATAVTWTVDDVDGHGRGAEEQGRRVRALRHAGHEARGRRPRRGQDERGVVQGPGRQHSRGR